jgi:xanthine/uracil permease
MVAVRCDMTACGVTTIISDNGVSHGEGHILVLVGTPSHAFGPAPAVVRSSSAPPVALEVGLIATALVVVLAFGLSVRRRRRG